MHVVDHLKELGVPKHAVLGDLFSWDTVTNALTLRMTIQGLLATHRSSDGSSSSSSSGGSGRGSNNVNRRQHPLNVEVFISDFHAARVSVAFTWVLDLEPSLLSKGGSINSNNNNDNNNKVVLNINKVNSEGIHWDSKDTFEARRKHEEAGVAQIEANRKKIKTMDELFAFLMLGGHGGLTNYLHKAHPAAAKGAGW
jgi:hypothetical protein